MGRNNGAKTTDMKRLITVVLVTLAAWNTYGQKVAIKTNVLYDLTTTINLGIETSLGRSVTLDISGNYNPWQFGDTEFKHWMVKPELRYRRCERFEGHFVGLHAT